MKTKKVKPTNVQEAVDLIKRYESITLKEIKKMFKEGLMPEKEGLMPESVANKLTGFGNAGTCTLCKAVGYGWRESSADKCPQCIHGYNHKIEGVACITGGEAGETAHRIDHANTPVKLRNAFRKRAIYLRKILKRRGITIPDL